LVGSKAATIIHNNINTPKKIFHGNSDLLLLYFQSVFAGIRLPLHAHFMTNYNIEK